MELFKWYFIIIFYLSKSNLINCADLKDYVTVSGCPGMQSGTNVDSKVKLSITLKKKPKWTIDERVMSKTNDLKIFEYSPFTKKAFTSNKRIKVIQNNRNRKVDLMVSFDSDKDAGEEFEFCFTASKSTGCMDFCNIHVNDNSKPRAILTMKQSTGIGMRVRGTYTEGDIVIVECKVITYASKKNFSIIFPRGAQINLQESTSDRKVYKLELTRSIKNKNISCIVDGGKNVTKSNFLYFINKIPITTPKNKTTIAISISVLFALMLCIMLPVGAYMLIIKQRRDNTKQMVEHHAQEAQTRMATQMTQMSRMSRMSRMSKMSAPEPQE